MWQINHFPGDIFHHDTWYILHSTTLDYLQDDQGKEVVYLTEAAAIAKCRELNDTTEGRA